MDLSRVSPAQFDILQPVVSELTAGGSILPESIMVLGAEARDILHQAHGHSFVLRGTSDVDLGLALESWHPHDAALEPFRQTGHTGIRYKIGITPVDIMPFGAVEDPTGEVAPDTRRGETFSVFAFQEVFEASSALSLPNGQIVRLPSSAGYGALKMRAWRDRWTISRNTKDGPDLATVLYWYFEDPDVSDRLYGSDDGVAVLQLANFDYPLAAARLLGRDVAQVIGGTRAEELRRVWTALDLDELAKDFGDEILPQWPTERTARRSLLDALTTGLLDP